MTLEAASTFEALQSGVEVVDCGHDCLDSMCPVRVAWDCCGGTGCADFFGPLATTSGCPMTCWFNEGQWFQVWGSEWRIGGLIKGVTCISQFLELWRIKTRSQINVLGCQVLEYGQFRLVVGERRCRSCVCCRLLEIKLEHLQNLPPKSLPEFPTGVRHD